MKLEFEQVRPDAGSSFRLIHEKVIAEKFGWEYHFHPELEIVCVLRGDGTRHIGNHFSRYQDGDLVLIGSNLPHDGFGLNAHGLHEEIVVQFKQELLDPLLTHSPEMGAIRELLEKAKYGLCFTGSTKQKVTRQLQRLTTLHSLDRLLDFFRILEALARSGPDMQVLNPELPLPGPMAKNNQRLQQIFSFVERHYHEKIDIRKVARLSHLSVPAFCNYFRKIMQCTFTDFVNQYRVQRACQLLLEDKTIYQTCYAAGFNHVTYFNKVFKAITGKTPSAFRQTIRLAAARLQDP